MRAPLLLCLAAAAACGSKKPVETSGRAAPQGLPALPSAAPAAAEPPAEGVTLAGKVVERIDAPPYSYLRIATAAGEEWAAVNQTDAAVGATVNVSGMTMAGFKSKTLDRTFDRIVFGVLGAGAAAAPASPHGAGAPGKAHTASPVASDVKVPLADGAGAVTIAALFARKAELADHEVAVRGKVVKINSGIMGKTWLHLQDGSGSPSAGDHDLTVTTGDAAALDDVVTIRGPVHLARDFGAGYSYAVIVEDARVQR